LILAKIAKRAQASAESGEEPFAYMHIIMLYLDLQKHIDSTLSQEF